MNNPNLIKDIRNTKFQSDPEFYRHIVLRLKRDSETQLCYRIYEDKSNGNWAAGHAFGEFMEWSVLDDLSRLPANWIEPQWFCNDAERAVKALEWYTAREIAFGKCEGRICEIWRIDIGGRGDEEYFGFWYDPGIANKEFDWSISPVNRITIVPKCVQGMFQGSSLEISMRGLEDFLNVDPANLYLFEVLEESDPLSIKTASDALLYHRPWSQIRAEDPREAFKGIDIVNDQEAFSKWFSKWPFALMLQFSPLETHPIMCAIEAKNGDRLKVCLDAVEVYGVYKWYSSHSRSLMQTAITSNSPACIRELLSHFYSEWDLTVQTNKEYCDAYYAIIHGKFDLVSLIYSIDPYYIEQGYYNAFESGEMSQDQLINAIRAGCDIGLQLNFATSNMYLQDVPVARRSVLLKMLVDSGSDINQEGYDGTVLETSMYYGQLEDVLMLIELGIDKNLAIEAAVKYDRHDILAALFELP
jgi:hypothetical protein